MLLVLLSQMAYQNQVKQFNIGIDFKKQTGSINEMKAIANEMTQ